MKKSTAALVIALVFITGCGTPAPAQTTDTSERPSLQSGSLSAEGSEQAVTDSVSEDRASTSSPGSNSEAQQNSFVGTYVGLHGSGLILYEDGTADYFWKDWNSVETGDSWCYDDGRVVVTSRSLGYDIYAKADAGADSLKFEADTVMWDAEVFIRTSNEARSLTVDEHVRLIEDRLHTSLNRPGSRTDTVSGTETTVGNLRKRQIISV